MGNAAQNMSAVRRLALGLLEQEESLSVGTKTSAFGRDGTTTTLRRSSGRFDAIAVRTYMEKNHGYLVDAK
jgi:hypothetical protein